MVNTQGIPWECLCKEVIEYNNIIWTIRMISCSFPKHFLQGWKSILDKASAFTQIVREPSIAAPEGTRGRGHNFKNMGLCLGNLARGSLIYFSYPIM